MFFFVYINIYIYVYKCLQGCGYTFILLTCYFLLPVVCCCGDEKMAWQIKCLEWDYDVVSFELTAHTHYEVTCLLNINIKALFWCWHTLALVKPGIWSSFFFVLKSVGNIDVICFVVVLFSKLQPLSECLFPRGPARMYTLLLIKIR